MYLSALSLFVLRYNSRKVASVMVSLAILSFPTAYAQESDFEESAGAVFDWINEIISPSIQDGNFDNDTTTNLQNTLDAGTDAGKKGVGLWWSVHLFVVNLIFTGVSETDYPVDKDLIIILSMFLVFIMMVGIVIHLARENTKLLVIGIAVLLALGAFGILVEF